jgi:hypothetical protein
MGTPAMPAPPDNNASAIVAAMASVNKTALQTGAMVSIAQIQAGVQTQQAHNQLLLGTEMLDANRDIKLAQIEAKLEAREMEHDETMAEIDNDRRDIKNDDSDDDFLDNLLDDEEMFA